MSVSPIDFLDSAKEYAQSSKEIDKRNAISRAYYASYHLTTQKFNIEDEFEPSNPSSGVHARFIDYMMRKPVGSTERKLGILLQKLVTKRRIADYKINLPLSSDALAMQLATSSEVFSILDETLSKP